MNTGHERNQETLNQIFNSHRPIKSGYAPYYNDSTISEKGKKAYEWLCDFVGQKLELGHHPWYGPTVYLDVNKMNITPEMLEEINNKMWEMDGNNSIAAQSGDWGYGNVYEVTFDQNHNVQSSRKGIKSEYNSDDSNVTEFYVSCGEYGQGGTVTVTKEEDGKWHGDDGKVFMGYLTPEEVVEWYDKDCGLAWLELGD